MNNKQLKECYKLHLITSLYDSIYMYVNSYEKLLRLIKCYDSNDKRILDKKHNIQEIKLYADYYQEISKKEYEMAIENRQNIIMKTRYYKRIIK